MITFFTTAKPFCGHSATIQRNALRSWQLLHPDVEVILFGDEEGAADAAREFGIRHVAQVRKVESGPKVLPSFFDVAQRLARHDLICYVNCDIVLAKDFLHALNAVDAIHGAFLMVGRRWNIDVDEPIAFRAQKWQEELVHRALAAGQQSTGDWIDYFAFRRASILGRCRRW